MTRRRRLSFIGLAVGAAFPVAAWLALQTDAASRAIRDKVIEGVEASIRGTVEVRSVTIEPTLAIRAEGVRLLAPDGAVAVSADRVRLRLDASTFLERRPVIFVEADAPALDLTPDADGKTALTRALEPDVPKTGETKGSRVSLSLALRGASLYRGPPPEEPDGTVFAAEDVRLAGELDTFEEGIRANLRGSGHLRSPRDERIALRTRLDTRGGAIRLDAARAVAGRSRATAEAVVIPVQEGGERAMPEGMLRANLRPADLARWAGRRVPSGVKLEATANAGQVVATALLDSGGTVSLVVRESEPGTWTGSVIAKDVTAPVWGLDGIRGATGEGLGAVAAFSARATDRAWAVHAQTSSFRFRQTLVEPIAATARGRGPDGIVATVSRFSVVEDGRRWTLARPATISRDAGRTTVAGLVLDGPGTQTVGVDGTWPPSRERPLAVVGRAILLEQLPRAFLPAGTKPRGRLDLAVRLDAAPREGDAVPDGKISLRVRRGRPGLVAPPAWLPAGELDLVANALLGKRRALVTIDARASSGESVRVTADVPLRLPRDTDHARVDLRGTGFRAGGLRHLGGRVHGGVAHRRLWLFASAADGEREIVRVAAAGPADLDALRRERLIPALAIWVERVDAAALATAGLAPEGVSGIARGAIVSDGHAISASIAGEDVRWGRWIDMDMTASARASGGLATASVRLAGNADDRAGGAVGVTAHLDPPLGRIAIAGLRSWRAAARGSLQDVRIAHAMTEQAPEAMRTSPDADGRLDAAIAVDGASGTKPTGWSWIAAKSLVVEGVPAGRIDALAHVRRDRAAASITATGRTPPGRDPATREGSLAMIASAGPWGPAGVLAAPFRAAAAADGFQLSSIAGLVREHVKGLTGTVGMRLIADGTLGNPVPRGRITVRDGALRQQEIGRLREIGLDASIAPDEIVLEELTARGARGGTLVAKAVARRNERVPRGARSLLEDTPLGWALTGEARARNFRIDGQRFAGSFDGNARIRGQLTQPLLVAKIEIDDATIRLPDVPEKTFQTLDDHPDFVVIGDGDRILVAGRDPAAPARRALAAKVRLVAPGTLRVTGRDVDLHLSADVKVDTSKEGGPHLTGKIEALRGTAKVAGKEFAVDHARIGFPGAPVAKAHLDIKADHVVERTDPDEDETTIHARVTGTVEDPKIAFTSDPAMPEDAVVSMLFLGASSPRSRDAAAGESPSLAGRAATLLGNYLTQRLRDEVQKVVPVDVLELETGSPGSTSEGSLRVGKYLAPGLFLSYAHSFGAAEDEAVNSVRLEWRLRKRWQVISEIHDGNRGHVDLVWTREF